VTLPPTLPVLSLAAAGAAPPGPWVETLLDPGVSFVLVYVPGVGAFLLWAPVLLLRCLGHRLFWVPCHARLWAGTHQRVTITAPLIPVVPPS
jgi:hypothetical protein